ncbi:SPOR domain-containing protein [Rhodobacteraceae bacterium]|nr:SPOR domain-containing protein [Paracoccaceae bacterium]
MSGLRHGGRPVAPRPGCGPHENHRTGPEPASKRDQMTRRAVSLTVALVASAFALAACQAGTGATAGGDVTRQIENPALFSMQAEAIRDTTDEAGDWVAVPGARALDQVLIRNTRNGRMTIGALRGGTKDGATKDEGAKLRVSASVAATLRMTPNTPAPLDIVALVADPNTDAAMTDQVIGTQAPPQAAGPTTAADTPPAPAAEKRPAPLLVLIGAFTTQAGATRARDAMSRAGIVTFTRPQQRAHQDTLWQVVAGPAASSAGRAELLKKIKGLGYHNARAISK